VNDAVCPTAAKNCRHLAEIAGDLPVVMQFDAHCEVTPSASRTHLTMLYTVAPGAGDLTVPTFAAAPDLFGVSARRNSVDS
jgi:hypothetical protein